MCQRKKMIDVYAVSACISFVSRRAGTIKRASFITTSLDFSSASRYFTSVVVGTCHSVLRVFNSWTSTAGHVVTRVWYSVLKNSKNPERERVASSASQFWVSRASHESARCSLARHFFQNPKRPHSGHLNVHKKGSFRFRHHKRVISNRFFHDF